SSSDAEGAPQQLRSFPTRRSSDLKEQVREIETQVMNIVSTLQKNIDAEDERDRHEKYAKLEALFNDGKRAYDTLRDTSLEFTHRSEEHTSELQSRFDLVCRLLLEK